jgi:hypothetical protein
VTDILFLFSYLSGINRSSYNPKLRCCYKYRCC